MDFSELFKNISLIIASGAVIYGVNAWRREFIGRRRIELAEEALVLFYEAKDALRWIRSPGGFVGEGQTRKPRENETPEEKEIFDHAYIVIERYNKQQELFNKIHAMRYRYMAKFGTQEANFRLR